MDGREVAKVRRPASEMWARRLAEASGLIAGAIEIFKVCSSPSMKVACYIDGRSCGQLVYWRFFALTELFSALAMTAGKPRSLSSSCDPCPRGCFCFPRCAGR